MSFNPDIEFAHRPRTYATVLDAENEDATMLLVPETDAPLRPSIDASTVESAELGYTSVPLVEESDESSTEESHMMSENEDDLSLRDRV